jgi:hypothetical protein
LLIETSQPLVGWEFFVTASLRRDWDTIAAFRIPIVVGDPFEEGVAYPGLTRKAEVSPIFIEYLISIVERDPPGINDLAEPSRAGQNAFRRGLGRCTDISDNRHIRVHDERHFVWLT